MFLEVDNDDGYIWLVDPLVSALVIGPSGQGKGLGPCEQPMAPLGRFVFGLIWFALPFELSSVVQMA